LHFSLSAHGIDPRVPHHAVVCWSKAARMAGWERTAAAAIGRGLQPFAVGRLGQALDLARKRQGHFDGTL
jgi:hypothetical protein